jgi:putative serine protease PepD
VVGVGVGAAVLSSLLTAGAITLANDNTTNTAGQPVASSSSQSAPPLVTGSGSVPAWGQVANAVEPSVVAVQVQAGNSGGEGSGVILDTTGRILTNNHVVSEAVGGQGQIRVVLSDGRAYPATIVGTDPTTDLAVIKMSSAPSGLKPATLGDSGAVKIGDPVMAIGNPLGLSDTVTTGIVSALNRPVSTSEGGQGQNPFGGGGTASEPVVTNAIQTDAAINPGNSGGALIDSGGRVIGITSSIASLSSGGGQAGSIGLGFAIPINEAKQVADQLVKTGKVDHSYLGVSLQDDEVTLDGAQREAAVLRSVSSGQAADKAGLKTGDAVIAINGQRVDGTNSLVGSIRAIAPGTKVTLTIVRDGKQQDISVTLGTRPATAG